jgi:hypothetical protein
MMDGVKDAKKEILAYMPEPAIWIREDNMNRRGFVKRSLIVSGGLASAATFEHRPLLAKMRGAPSAAPDSTPGSLPTGRIGKLNVTRLICGGNLFSGFAHSGEFTYVSDLLKHYFVEDKILDTLQLCEQNGINTAILRSDDHMVGILKRYHKERGGKLQWIAQTYPDIGKLKENVQMAIDNGAVGAFIMGGKSEQFYKKGRVDLIGEVIAFIRQNGLVAGVGAHMVAILQAVEEMKIEPDFWFKTFNSNGYALAPNDFKNTATGLDESPDGIAAYMKATKKPWIAFKVLAAGRVKPREGLDLAFQKGADFVNVGMYDFQVKEDVALVKEVVLAHAQRERPWRA